MKLPGVSGVYDYAGPDRNSRYRSRPCCLPPMQKRQRPDCIFSKLNTQPTCTPVYASLITSRCPTQNSGPSGSLLLSRRTLAFPASCRFIPAHRIGDFAATRNSLDMETHLSGPKPLLRSRRRREDPRVGSDSYTSLEVLSGLQVSCRAFQTREDSSSVYIELVEFSQHTFLRIGGVPAEK